MENRNDRFLALYNRLDEAIRTKFSQENTSYSAINYYIGKLRKNGGQKAYEKSEELDALRELRNSLVHMVRIRGEEAFEVSEASLEALESVYSYLMDPPLLMDTAIPYSKLLTCKADTNVLELSKRMCEKGIGHVPLMEGRKCVGAFSESSLFHYMAIHPDADLSKLTVKDLGEHVSFEGERGERYKFVARNYLLEEAIHEALSSKAETGKRLGLFLITETGEESQALLAANTGAGLSS